MTTNKYIKLAEEMVEYTQDIENLAINNLAALYKVSNNHYVGDMEFLKGYKKLHKIIEKVEGTE